MNWSFDLNIPQHVTLVHHIDDIVLIESDKQELASTSLPIYITEI